MHNLSILCITVFVITVSGCSPKSVTCEIEDKFPSGGPEGAILELPLQDNEVIGISYESLGYAGVEGAVYACTVKASALDGNSVWSRKENKTFVKSAFRYPTGQETTSIFEINKTQTGYEVMFLNMSNDHCGGGAELPKRIKIERGNAKCLVEYRKK
jgi:hypothetical protein